MNKLCALLVSAVFLAITAFEVYHRLILWEPWAGYAPVAAYVLLVLAPFWVLGAVSVWVARAWGWAGVLAGVFAVVVHGVGVRLGGDPLGTALVGVAPVLLVLSAVARHRRHVAREEGAPAAAR